MIKKILVIVMIFSLYGCKEELSDTSWEPNLFFEMASQDVLEEREFIYDELIDLMVEESSHGYSHISYDYSALDPEEVYLSMTVQLSDEDFNALYSTVSNLLQGHVKFEINNVIRHIWDTSHQVEVLRKDDLNQVIILGDNSFSYAGSKHCKLIVIKYETFNSLKGFDDEEVFMKDIEVNEAFDLNLALDSSWTISQARLKRIPYELLDSKKKRNKNRRTYETI